MAKQITLLLIASVIALSSTAQNNSVGIGTTTPDASSKLEINSDNAGLLIPRLTAAQRMAISNPANGLLVFDTDSAAFAYRTGGTWLFLNGKKSKANDWSTIGNSGTGTGNFIGTTDDKPLRFKIKNIGAGIVDSSYFNTGLGFMSLDSNTTGLGNTAVGFKSLSSNKNGGGNVAIGYKTLFTNTSGNDNIAIGRFSLYQNTTGLANTAIGREALYFNQEGNFNTAIGYSSLWKNTTGEYNSASGYSSLQENTTGKYNTAHGAQSMVLNTIGEYNTALGNKALFGNISGNNNTAIGNNALYNSSTGSNNTASGNQALSSNVSGSLNTATGAFALDNNWTGRNNTANGAYALNSNTSGSYNVADGYNSLGASTTAQYNTAVGYNAGSNYENGFYNVFIGSDADVTGAGFTNAICIGTNATCTASNQVTIGTVSSNSYRVYANWSNISDGRFKRNVQENVPGLSFITQLRPVTYHIAATSLDKFIHRNRKDSTGTLLSRVYDAGLIEKEKITYTGFVAQEVETVAKSLGFDFSGVDAPKNEDDTYGLRYADFVVPLVKAVQEQQQEIEALKKEIQLLKEKIK